MCNSHSRASRVILLASIILILGQLSLRAEIKIDTMFTDHMVLQRGMKVPVWGTAPAAKKIQLHYAPGKGCTNSPQKIEALVAQNGTWKLLLEPLVASDKGAQLTVTSDRDELKSVVLKEVVVGEVWLGSGQSNMAYGTRHFTEYDKELKKASMGGPYPSLRIYHERKWQPADSENLPNFSALLFSFGHALQHELDVPVGLMVAAVNGTPSGSWMSEDMAKENPELMTLFRQKSGFESLAEMATDWRTQKKLFNQKKKTADPKEQKRTRFSHPGLPVGFHFKKIEAYIPFGIRGVLWDQGESGTKIPGVDQYTAMSALIKGWRKSWNQGEFPFLHIQKPSGGGCAWAESDFTGQKKPLSWQKLPDEPLPENRNCIKNLLHIQMGTIHNAPMVTTSDLTPGVHPAHKYSYGRRACRVALGRVYGRKIATCGPVYQSHEIRDSRIIISYDNLGKGLSYRHSDKLHGFEIAAKDLKWQWANAIIENDKVIVSSSKVANPLHVRYAFNGKNFNWANLFNKDGLPALMFTTAP